MASQPADPYTWGEASPGITVGPLGDFKLFRSACGEQLWGRWIPKGDFTLIRYIVTSPTGRSLDTQLFSPLILKDKQKKVYLLESERPGITWETGEYQINLRVQGTDGTTTSYDLKAMAESMYKSPGLLTFVSARQQAGTQYVTFGSQLNGDVQRVITYDSRGCWVATETIASSSAAIQKGQNSDIQLSTSLATTSRYSFVVQGLDKDSNAVYYATTETP